MMVRWLCLWLACFLSVTLQHVSVMAAAQSVAEDPSTTIEEFGIDLYALSDAELKEICTSRGFELVQEVDDETGSEYEFTHEEFVEAAKQCLSIERDMEEIIAQHPEILEELEAEKERMLEENERLQTELASAEQDGEKASETMEDFVSDVDTGDQGGGAVESPEAEAIESEPIVESKQARSVEPQDSLANTSNQTDLETPREKERPPSLEAFAKDTVVEFRKRVQQDLKRLVDRVLPESIQRSIALVVRPVFRIAKQAGKNLFAFVARHVRVLVKETSRKLAERAKQKEENASQETQQT